MRQQQEKYEHYDKEIWKDKKCYNYGKTGHPVSDSQKNFKETPDEKQDDKKSKTSRSSKSSRSNKSDIQNLNKAIQNSFTTFDKKIDELENEYSDLTSSGSEDSDGDSHFKFHNNVMEPQKGLQMSQIGRNNGNQTPRVGVVLQHAPTKRINKVLLYKKHTD